MPTLRLFAQARDAAGGLRAASVDGGTVAEVLDAAVARFGPGFAEVLGTAAVWVDGEPVERDRRAETPVGPSAEVAVLPPVSGGCQGPAAPDGRTVPGMASPDPLADDLLEGLEALTLDEVRERRAACQEVENGLSYVRRLAQGRLDIVLHELAVRAGTAEHSDDIVADLTAALAEHLVAPGLGHLPTTLAPAEVDPELLRRLDEVAHPAHLTEPQQVPEAELQEVAAGLQAYERELSERRRSLLDRIDALQAEIIRRYRDGSADVDALLQG